MTEARGQFQARRTAGRFVPLTMPSTETLLGYD
jgi:hypothetical protein